MFSILLLLLGFQESRFCVWDGYQRVSLGSILVEGEGKHRIGQRRNLAVMGTSCFSQHLKEALELKWFIRDSPCCIKMAKWLCFCFYGFF